MLVNWHIAPAKLEEFLGVVPSEVIGNRCYVLTHCEWFVYCVVNSYIIFLSGIIKSSYTITYGQRNNLEFVFLLEL